MRLLGCRRAGRYSYDGLDGGGVPVGPGLMLRLFWHPLGLGMQRRRLLNFERLAGTT
jgi:hypothetical protein